MISFPTNPPLSIKLKDEIRVLFLNYRAVWWGFFKC